MAYEDDDWQDPSIEPDVSDEPAVSAPEPEPEEEWQRYQEPEDTAVEQPDQTEQPDRVEQAEQSEQAEQAEQAEQVEPPLPRNQYASVDTGVVSDAKAPEETWTRYKDPDDAKDEVWQRYVEPPEAEGKLGTFIREIGHGVGPAAAAAGGGMMTGGALGSVWPGAGTFVGGLLGGAIAGYGAAYGQEKLLEAAGASDAAQREANRQENPWSSAAGAGVSNLAGFGAGLVRGGTTMLGRLLSGGISGAGEVGMQAAQGTPLSEAIPPVIASTAAGAAFPDPYKWGLQAEKLGQRFAGAHIRPEVPAVKPPPPPAVQETLPFKGGNEPYTARPAQPTAEELLVNPSAQPAEPPRPGIGGGERQPDLFPKPPEPPAEPPAPGTPPRMGPADAGDLTQQRQLPLEPAPTVNREGQYGFNVEAPDRTGVTSRPATPDTGGASKVVAPPPASDQPHSTTRYGKEDVARRGVSSESGINVLQPGQTDVAVNYGLRYRTGQTEGDTFTINDPAFKRGGTAEVQVERNPTTGVVEAIRANNERHVVPSVYRNQPTNEIIARMFGSHPYQANPDVSQVRRGGIPAEPPRTVFEPPRPPPAPPARPEPIPRERALVPRVPETTQGVMTEPPVPRGMTRMYQGERAPPREWSTDRATAERYGPAKYVDVTGAEAQHFQPGRMGHPEFVTNNPIYRQRARPIEALPTQPVRRPGGPEAPRGPVPGERPVTPPPERPTVRTASPDLEQRLKAMTPEVPPKAAAAVATSKAAGTGPGKVKVSGATTPTGELKYTHKMTVREAMDAHGPTGLMDKLTPFIRDKIVAAIGKMPVHFMNNAEFARARMNNYMGLYFHRENMIAINNKYVGDRAEMARTILHEAVHGATSHALLTVPAVRAAVKAIMLDVKARAGSRVSASDYGRVQNAFKNEREFVADAFSNRAVQQMLADHILSPSVAKRLQEHFDMQRPIRSAWDAMVQTVRSVLGLKPEQTSALDALMKATAHAMDANPKAKAEFMKSRGWEKPENYRDAAPPPGKEEVVARDKFGNEARFTGQTTHAAAAFAKAAGYKPHQIFNKDGSAYTPPKAGSTAAAPAAAAPAAPTSATAPSTAAAAGGAAPPSRAVAPTAKTVEEARQSMLDRVAEKPPWYSKIPTTKEQVKERWRAFYTAVKNALDPIEQLKKLDTAKTLKPEDDFAMLARLTKGMGGRFQAMIKKGTYDINTGTKNGKGLDEIIKPINDDPNGFTAYALAKRTIELEGRGIKTGMNVDNARMVVKADQAKFEPVFRELVDFQGRVLDNLVKSGILSVQQATKMRQLNKEYVPFYRMLDPNSELGQQLGAGLQTRNPVFKIKGSDKDIFDPVDSIIKNTYVFTDLAHRNQALVAMKKFNDSLPADKQFMQRDRSSHPIEVKEAELQKFMDKHGIEGFADDTLTIFRPDAFRPAADKIRLYNNGKAEIYKVPENVGAAVNSMDKQSFNLFTKIMSTPASWLRAGAVLSPEFMLRNPLRDIIGAFVQSKHGSLPFVGFYTGMKHIFKDTQHYQEWMMNGGANANLVSMDRAVLHTNPMSVAGQVANAVVNPKQWLHMLRTVSEFSENASRVGMYVRAREKGIHRIEAAYESREGTLDFARMGASPLYRAFNAMVPFLNARVEGLDRASRAFRDDPIGFTTKAGASVTLPSVLLWFYNKDNERVAEIEQWQKDLFWIIPTDNWVPMTKDERARFPEDLSKLKNTVRQDADGTFSKNNGTIFRIPKPFEIGVIFGSVPERILDAYYKDNPNGFKSLDKTLEQALIPSVVPQAVLPIMEQWANKSVFLDRSLLTEKEQKLPPAQQVNPRTTETAKVLGSIIRTVAGDKSGIGSPIIIDNYIRQWSGGLGAHVTSLIDAGIKTQQDRVPPPTTSMADMPGIKAFVARFPSAQAQSIKDFYDTRSERKMEQAGIKDQRKTDPEGANARAQKSSAWVGDDFAKVLQADRDAVTRITADRNMTPDQKRSAIDLTYMIMIEHAKRANEAFTRTQKQRQQAQ